MHGEKNWRETQGGHSCGNGVLLAFSFQLPVRPADGLEGFGGPCMPGLVDLTCSNSHNQSSKERIEAISALAMALPREHNISFVEGVRGPFLAARCSRIVPVEGSEPRWIPLAALSDFGSFSGPTKTQDDIEDDHGMAIRSITH